MSIELRTYLQNDNSYDAKIVAIKKYATSRQLREWSIKVAESVLHIYEDKCPNDSRIRDCIQASKDYLVGTIGIDELNSKRKAANFASYAAHAAAYAAANATNATAYAVANADHAAAYAVAYAAADAASNKPEQQELNIKLMIDVLEVKIPDTKVARKLYDGKIIRVENGMLIV